MNSLVIVGTALIAWAAVLPSNSVFAQEETLRRAPRIPAMVNKWAPPGDPLREAPEITIREIGQCMGTEMRIEDRVDGIRQQQAGLEALHADVSAQSEALSRTLSGIERDELRLLDASKALRERFADLERRSKAIEAGRRTSRSQVEVDRLNAEIAAYNRDVADARRTLEDARKSKAAVKVEIAAYNESVAALNERVTDFKRRAEAFKSAHETFDRDVAHYKDRCTGERRVKR